MHGYVQAAAHPRLVVFLRQLHIDGHAGWSIEACPTDIDKPKFVLSGLLLPTPCGKRGPGPLRILLLCHCGKTFASQADAVGPPERGQRAKIGSSRLPSALFVFVLLWSGEGHYGIRGACLLP